MSNQPKNCLLVNSSGVSGSGVGSLFLRDLIADAPSCFNFIEYKIQPFIIGGMLSRNSFLYRVFSSIVVRIGILQHQRLLYYINKVLNEEVLKIEKKIKDGNYKFIWLIASTPELIFLGNRLVNKGYDIRVTVWDDPEYIAQNLRLPPSFITILMEAFGNLMTKAKKGMVISYSMQFQYYKKYKLDSIIVRHGIKEQKFIKEKKINKDINIVFAGSLYCKHEWNYLVKALNSVDWKINNKDIYIHHIGMFPKYGATKNKNIKLYGFQPFDKTLMLLSTMDIGYLPYWFSRKYKIPAQTSFPGKMSAYAATGLAIFHHAPDYTEVTSFLNRYKFGVCCHSNATKTILKELNSLILSLDSKEYSENRTLAMHYELSSESNKSKFLSFIS